MIENTLESQIEAFKAELTRQAPEAVAQFQGDIDALVRTGIARNSLKEGAQAPDFTLPDSAGKEVSLSGLLREGPVVVTFYRGEWCPYCNLQLRAYQKILPQIKEFGAMLVAVSPQTPDHTLSTVEEKELTFPVLSDAGNQVARWYGLVFSVSEAVRPLYRDMGLDLAVFNGHDSWELPMPGTFIVDQTGSVRLAFVDEDYTRRLEPAALLAGLRNINQQR